MFQPVLLVISVLVCHAAASVGIQFQQSDQTGATPSNVSAEGWDRIDVSPTAFLSIVYKDNFRISVFKTDDPNDSAVYYFTPALVLNATSPISSFNMFLNRHEVTFTVTMWDENYETHIRHALENATRSSIPSHRVRVLPIERIRIDTEGVTSENLQVLNTWVSYANQPSHFKFRFVCKVAEVCTAAAENMKQEPRDFVQDLLVSYRLTTQSSAPRKVNVTAEHVQSTGMHSAVQYLQYPLPELQTIHLVPRNQEALASEIATGLLGSEAHGRNPAFQDQTPGISGQLKDPNLYWELNSRINIVHMDQELKDTPLERRMAELEQRLELETMTLHEGIVASAPTGTITMIYTQVTPVGWLECNGSAINCTAYAKLCQVTGLTRTPDLRDRFPMGVSSSGSLGRIGGEAAHTLTLGEMPSHEHSYSRLPSPFMDNGQWHLPAGDYYYWYVPSEWGNPPYDTFDTTGRAGSNLPHNNLPPFLTVKFIIKT